MTEPKPPSNVLNIALWIAQLVLAASLVWASMLKLFQPIEKLSAMWPWVAQVPVMLVKATGIVDLIAALGLVIPQLLGKPKLTALAAIGIIMLMVCASIFHISRGEASVIGVNIMFAVIAAVIVWGRLRKI
jgi:hypothetical protein